MKCICKLIFIILNVYSIYITQIPIFSWNILPCENDGALLCQLIFLYPSNVLLSFKSSNISKFINQVTGTSIQIVNLERVSGKEGFVSSFLLTKNTCAEFKPICIYKAILHSEILTFCSLICVHFHFLSGAFLHYICLNDTKKDQSGYFKNRIKGFPVGFD